MDIRLSLNKHFNAGVPKKTVDFPNPWVDYASTALPTTLKDALEMAEYIWLSNGTYRQACNKVAKYFITDFDILNIDNKQSDKISETLRDELHILDTLALLGSNFLCYGNVFVALTQAFDRSLGYAGNLFEFDKAFEAGFVDWKDYEFVLTAEAKRALRSAGVTSFPTEKWAVIDQYRKDLNQTRVLLLNPHEVEIKYDEASGVKRYTWNMTKQYVDKITQGDQLVLRHAQLSMIAAVKGSKNRYTFNDGVIFHHIEPAPAGLYTGGWGLPSIISNFRTAYHIQVLNRFDQAIALDYINGIRVISPETGTNASSSGDPIMGGGGSMFKSVVENIISNHRADPASWNISGFPLRYQIFGAEGAQLSPKDLILAKNTELLNDTGVPQELYTGSLTIQAAPVGLRLFERTWSTVPSLYQRFLSFYARYIQQVGSLEPFKIKLRPVDIIDNLENKAYAIQMAGAGQLAPQTALAAIGRDGSYREELRKYYEAERIRAEEEQSHAESMADLQNAEMVKQDMLAKQQMATGQMPPEGMPSAPPGAAPAGLDPTALAASATPEGRLSEAEAQAQEIMTMESTARRQTLINMKKTDATLHALVKQKLEDLEQQAGTQGVSMARQGQI